ncbi:hypothetical protein ACFPIJ_43815 [Dactylosporangium cerinum]|uniref:Uncharacterized protein n=1 Tax=Dactylosporangium cerinum TaxID=1434730 RepID=A0ABV9WBB6_9ACTN
MAAGVAAFRQVLEEFDTEMGESPEFAVADAIIRLGTNVMAERRMRVLTVLKLRGSGFLSGQHAYRLSQAGLDLFPRLADTGEGSTYQLHDTRISTGVTGLDALTILKARASRHDVAVRQYTITDRGITLGDAFAPGQDLR